MNNKDPCFGCHTNKICEIRNFLIIKNFEMILEVCPCIECIVKPSCMKDCDRRGQFSSLFSKTHFGEIFFSK